MVAKQHETGLPAGTQVRLLRSVGRWSAGQRATVLDGIGGDILVVVDQRINANPGSGGAYDAFLADPGDIVAESGNDA